MLHHRTNIVAKNEQRILTNELREWKRNGTASIGHSQGYLLDYAYAELNKWVINMLRLMVKLLSKAAENCCCQQLNPSQRLIPEFFQPNDILDQNEEARDDG